MLSLLDSAGTFLQCNDLSELEKQSKYQMTKLIVSPQSPFCLSRSSLLRLVPSIISSNFSQLLSPYALSHLFVCACMCVWVTLLNCMAIYGDQIKLPDSLACIKQSTTITHIHLNTHTHAHTHTVEKEDHLKSRIQDQIKGKSALGFLPFVRHHLFFKKPYSASFFLSLMDF